VMETGSGVSGFAPGDRVASNGKHAEVVSVPANLCARIPPLVSDEEAAFTVIGAIALQGIRLVRPTLGEAVVVTGLGLIGLVAVQLLRAHGCRVLGIDLDAEKLALAREFGAEVVNLAAGEDPVAAAQAYGPGRYDTNYEEKGQDYPVGYVRWTEQRNFEAVLDMLSDGRLNVQPLISHRFPIDASEDAYALIGGAEPALGILLRYPTPAEKPEVEVRRTSVRLAGSHAAAGAAALGFIGSGNYATAVLIPAFKATGARLKVVASNGGVSGLHAGRKYGFEASTTDTDSIFADPQVNAVVITTRHDSHAALVCQALAAGKHVFVEKPLAMNHEELAAIEQAHAIAVATGRSLVVMVGFNRRFSPQVQKIRSLLEGTRGPKAFVMTVNAGAIPSEHWTQDLAVGGGRIIGEGCHFIDLLRFLAGVEITAHHSVRLQAATADTVTIQLAFADGSIGTIHYFANGSKSYPKERLEVFAAGRVLQLDNFRKLTGFGWPGFTKMNLWRQDKGQRNCAGMFVNVVEKGGFTPIPLAEVLEVSRISIEVAANLR